MIVSKSAFAVAFLALALALVARSATGQTIAQPPNSVQISAAPIDLNGPVFYAQELGYFKKAGLDVHIQLTFAGVEAAAAALLAGSTDVGSANTATIAQAHLRGIDFRFFAPAGIFTESARPTEVVAVLKTSTIRTAADLNGKTIAVNSLSSMLQVATEAWLDNHGGNGKSIQFVEVAFPQMDAALEQHRIDAAVFTEPFATAAGDDTRVIGSPEEGVAPTFMTLGWYSTAAWLNAHPDVARRLVTALREGAAWGNTHLKESAAILSKYSKIPVSNANQMARAVYGLTLEAKLIQAPLDVAARYHFIAHTFPASEIMWAAKGATQ